MRFNSIQLQNYLCFENITVELHKHFNAIVGINGSGKTTLLKAFKNFLLIFFELPTYTDKNFIEPRIISIKKGQSYRFEPQYPLRIQSEFLFNNDSTINNYFCEKLTATSDMTREGKIINLPHLSTQNSDDTMPLIVFYTANRNLDYQDRQDIILIDQKKVSRFDAFKDWESPNLGSDDLKVWVIAKTFERLQDFEQTGKNISDLDQATDELSFVNKAISTVIPETKGLRYDAGQKSLIMEWKDADDSVAPNMHFDKLSAGQQSVIGLIADLARRACLLNPHLGSEVISKTPGVVLIDELDLHLHPGWQRRVPKGLKEAFPEMQFIATTHSPLILSELTPSEIIILDNFQAYAPESSYGLESDHILVKIFDTPTRPNEIDTQVRNMFAAIEEGELEKAKAILKYLSDTAPGILEIATANALILRREIIGR
jgi:predicted ATP-binding protein involved in virulence